MNLRKKLILMIVIFAMIIPQAGTFAADKTVTVSARSFVTSAQPDTSSAASLTNFTLTPYETTPSALYLSYNLSNVTVPDGKYIKSAMLAVNIFKNTEFTNGDLLVRSCDGDFTSGSLTYNTAPELKEFIGKKSNLSLTMNKMERIDITAAVVEALKENRSKVSFALLNYGNADCRVMPTNLELTYTSEKSELTFGKGRFYKGAPAEKNYVINSSHGGSMYFYLPVSGVTEGKKLNISIASYTEDNVLTEINQFEKTVYSGSDASFIGFEFEHKKEASYTRAFVWDSDMTPYTESAYLTEKSYAELNSVKINAGQLAPMFNPDVYEYSLLFDKLPDEFPEIIAECNPGMKIRRIIPENVSEPYIIEVTSADLNKTVRYSFKCVEKETAVISSHIVEAENTVYSLPCEESVNVNNGAMLAFDKDYVYGEKSSVSKAVLSLCLKAPDGGKLEVYTNSDCEKLISNINLFASDDYTAYDIPVASDEFTDINSINLYVKGNGEIWTGENGVESSERKRIPYITVDYGKTEEDKENTLFWDDRTKVFSGYYEYGTLPEDKYQSSQNPPSFIWPYVDFADSYQLILAKDEELRNVVAYENSGTLNMKTLPFELEPGNYYWSVRAVKGSEYTEWMDVRRVTVLSDAVSLPVPEIKYIKEALKTASHPRILTTQELLEDFRGLKDKGVYGIYESIISDADAAVNKPITTTPVYSGNLSTYSEKVNAVTDQIEACSYAYLITGESKYGTTAVKLLKKAAGWSLYYQATENGETKTYTTYKIDSQLYRTVLYALTVGYDSVWNLLTEEEKTSIENAIEARMNILEHPVDGLQDAAYRLEYTPSISHGWSASEAILASAVVLAGHSDSADTILDGYMPRYLAMNATQTGYQDGGFSGGFAYSSYDSEGYAVRALNNLGIYDMTKSAQYRNLWKNYFYTVFNLTAMEFGDGSYGWGATYDAAKLLRLYARFSKSPYAVWKYKSIKIPLQDEIETYFVGAETTDVEPKRPVDLPKSYAFKDSGYVAMHSDLEDENKVSLYFRSSPYGSAAHAHADHNSFHIQAFGERLAIDSGYYDTVNTDHSTKYKRETYAHNAVTHSGGKGQANKTLQAKGKITNFLTGEYFDLTSGDATETYNYYNKTTSNVIYEKEMDKAVRHIIYIRPDYFIVIDDLKAVDNKETTFEWWLNAYEDINFSEGKNGAIIRKNQAELEAEILYPANITKGGKSTDFADINGNVWPAEGDYSYLQKHQRVWFTTAPVNETGIISVINVRKTNDEKKEYKTEYHSDYIKISFSDGTNAYIRTINSGKEIVTDDGITFNGAAFVIKNKEFMLVDGTKASLNGEMLVNSTKTISVSKYKNNIGLSGLNDATVTVSTDKVHSISDERGNIIGENSDGLGITAKYNNGKLNVDMLSGFYSLKLVTSTSDAGIPLTEY